MKNIVSTYEIDELANDRIYGQFLTPEQKIIQTFDQSGVLKLALVRAFCLEIINAGRLPSFDAIAECMLEAWRQITAEKPLEEMMDELQTKHDQLEISLEDLERRVKG